MIVQPKLIRCLDCYGKVYIVMVGTPVTLDRINIRILSHLQQTGRISSANLAKAVGLTPYLCLARVKQLKRDGYVTGYGAYIELGKIRNLQLVFTQVTLSDHRPEKVARFEAVIRRIDEIIECHLVKNEFDHLLKFVVTGVAHYQTIIEGLLDSQIGIEKYFSYIVIKTPFAKSYYPVEKLLLPTG